MRNSFKPNFRTNARTTGRNLVFCFDGTWNDPSDMYEKGSDITNVRKTFEALIESDAQKRFYYEGVGTGGTVDKYLGGLTGKGADKIRNEAYIELVKNYAPGDKIFVTGFSRGAAIARMFAYLIHKEGIPERIKYNRKKSKFKVKGKTLSKPGVEMLGIYDTVASFGLPSEIAGIDFQQINLFKNFDIAPSTKQVTHLLGVHEGRNTFKPTLCNIREGVDEIWFPGVHADVGGGYADSGIADIALDFMVKRFQKLGVEFSPSKIREIKPTITGNVHDKVKEEYALKLVHRSIEVWSNGEPIDQAPKIHQSVWDREQRLGNRLPPHLKKVENKYIAVHGDEVVSVSNMG